MRKYLLIVFLMLLTACNSTTPTPSNLSKNDNKEMKSLNLALSEYTQATLSNDVNKLISFIYPKLFTIVSKDKMINMLRRNFKSGQIPKIKDVKHLKIEPIKKYDAGLYSIITSSMTTILKSPRPNDNKFEAYMLATVQRQLGAEGNVTLDREKHLFNVQHTTKTIALNEEGSWKFMGFKQVPKYIENGIFPKMLIERVEEK